MRGILTFPASIEEVSDFFIETKSLTSSGHRTLGVSTPPNGKESVEMYNLQQRFEKILLGESDVKNFSHSEVTPILKKIGRVLSSNEERKTKNFLTTK